MSRPSKKQKREQATISTSNETDTSKPTAVFTPRQGRDWTVSIALPGSIIANAQTHDLKTALAGSIARACAVFCVDEIVVFDDGQAQAREPEHGGYTAFADPNFFLYHVLSYLEAPPYLRKALFPMHPDLRTAGALPSLDMPHHLKQHEWCEFREGVSGHASGSNATKVNCGLEHEVQVTASIPEGTRVTLHLPTAAPPVHEHITAKAVSPDLPRQLSGYYWGYSLRQASSLGAIFTECEFDGGYDLCIGTSERGKPVDTLTSQHDESSVKPNWKHLLVVIGGVTGLEAALKADQGLATTGIQQVSELFDRWIDVVPGQGSRTIRTEEALWITLSRLRPLVEMR